MLEQCWNNDSMNLIRIVGRHSEKNASFNLVYTWFDINLPNIETVIKILMILNIISCTLGSNVPVTSFNTIKRSDDNLLYAEIIGIVQLFVVADTDCTTDSIVFTLLCDKVRPEWNSNWNPLRIPSDLNYKYFPLYIY